MTQPYSSAELPREDIDALVDSTVLEFGTSWCGYCQGAQPLIEAAFAAHPNVQHLKVEDGKGRRLGRSFQVKLWPTLIFLQDGKEVARVVRPESVEAINEAFASFTTGTRAHRD